MTVSAQHESLWNPVASVHEHPRGFTICPTDAKSEMKITRELLHFAARGHWIFSSERDEFDLATGVFLSHFFIVRHFPATWPTPGGPQVDNNHFAVEVRQAKCAVVDGFQFVIEQTFRQRARSDGPSGNFFRLGPQRFLSRRGR